MTMSEPTSTSTTKYYVLNLDLQLYRGMGYLVARILPTIVLRRLRRT
jgi:hypothetical protein